MKMIELKLGDVFYFTDDTYGIYLVDHVDEKYDWIVCKEFGHGYESVFDPSNAPPNIQVTVIHNKYRGV